MPRSNVKSLLRREHESLVAMIVAARQAAGLSQGELADKVGLSQPALSDIESGKRRVDLVELVDLLRAMDVEPTEFIRQYLQKTSS